MAAQVEGSTDVVSADIGDDNEVVTLPISPGRLGLTLRITPNFGATIVGIDAACTFRDEISVGDRIVEIDRRKVKKLMNIAAGNKKVRLFTIVRKKRKEREEGRVEEAMAEVVRDSGKERKEGEKREPCGDSRRVVGTSSAKKKRPRREKIRTSPDDMRLTAEDMFLREERSGGKRSWRCFICREATFGRYQDCMVHEGRCNARKELDSLEDSESLAAAKRAKGVVWQCDVCRDMEFDNYDDCAAHEVKCKKRKEARKKVYAVVQESDGEPSVSKKPQADISANQPRKQRVRVAPATADSMKKDTDTQYLTTLNSSCDFCRSKHVKCDGLKPCGYCKFKYKKKHKLTNVGGVDRKEFNCNYSLEKRKGRRVGCRQSITLHHI